jgi:hypothetical protein
LLNKNKKITMLFICLLALFALIYLVNFMSNKMLGKYYGNKSNKLYHSKNKSLSVYLMKKCSTVKASGHYYLLKDQLRLQCFLVCANCRQDINSEKLEFDFTSLNLCGASF